MRTALVVAGTTLAAAAVAWLLSVVLIGRITAGRLPRLPDLSADPAAVLDAITTADAAARRWPSARSIGDLAMAYHASLNPDEARETYAIAATLAPSDWRWTYYQGLLLEEHGDQVGAEEAFARVAREAPNHGLARFHLAELAFKAGRLDDAETSYLAAQTITTADSPPPLAALPPRRAIPLSAYASLGLARVQLERGNRQAGRDRLAAIVGAHPDFGSAHALLRRLGDDAPAIGADDGRAYVPPADPWLDAVVTRSWHPDLLLKHAALAARAGDVAWREWLVRRALAASPNGLDVLLETAAMLQAAGRQTEALDYLRRAETVAPNDHHTLVEQGKTLADLGQLAEAEAVLRRAVRVRDAAAEYNLGTVLDRQERWGEARDHYERALAIDPFHARAMNNLAIGFGVRGDLARALALYRRATEAAPDLADTYTNLGAALAAQGQFSEALATLDLAIRLAPGAANAHNNRGIALAQLGRFAEARASFETALRLVPAHGDARRNLAALDPQP